MLETIHFTCQDGYKLTGCFYPSSVNPANTTPILIAPATGIVQQFYAAFAKWLADQGFNVLTFDFRGIGASLQGSLKHSKASIVDWGRLDIPAAIDALLAKTQASDVTLIGHSAGGQLLGFAANYQKVKQVIAVAGSTGHVKNLTGKTKFLAPVMFNLIFPISTRLVGYGATKFVGMGENLPKDVARQWAYFCSKPGYAYNAVGHLVDIDFHNDIQCPITVVIATDDQIATHANAQDLMRLYPHAPTTLVELSPAKFGFDDIGHMLMFKRSHSAVWPVLVASIL